MAEDSAASGPALRVAIASNDGVHVNECFGRVWAYRIYEEAADGWRLIELRPSPVPCRDQQHDEEVLQGAIALLADCRAVLAGKIGPAAIELCRRHGITAFSINLGIDAALKRVGARRELFLSGTRGERCLRKGAHPHLFSSTKMQTFRMALNPSDRMTWHVIARKGGADEQGNQTGRNLRKRREREVDDFFQYQRGADALWIPRAALFLGHWHGNHTASRLGIPSHVIYNTAYGYLGYRGAYDLARRLHRKLSNPAFTNRLAQYGRLPYRADW